jgi:hypothetical protein
MSHSSDKKAQKYKVKYLNLKNTMTGGHHMDSNATFNQDLANLVFVCDNMVLGDDAKAVILALTESFNQISARGLPSFDLELSHPFILGDQIHSGKFTGCWIVLQYCDTPVCMTNSRISTEYPAQQSTLRDMNPNQEVSCELTRGLVKYWLKGEKDTSSWMTSDDSHNKKVFEYSRISVVRAQVVDSLGHIHTQLYQNSTTIDAMNAKTSQAIAATQQQILSQQAANGSLNVTNPSQMSSVVSKVNQMNADTRTGAVLASIQRTSTASLDTVPDQQAVDAAEIVSRNLDPSSGLSAVLVPGSNAVPISNGMSGTPAMINSKSTYPTSSIVTGVPAIDITSNMVFVPTRTVATNANVMAASGSRASQNILSGGQASDMGIITVVPVSSSLSVAVPTANANLAASSVPIPSNMSKSSKAKGSTASNASASNGTDMLTQAGNELSAAVASAAAALGLTSATQPTAAQSQAHMNKASQQLLQQQTASLRGPSSIPMTNAQRQSSLQQQMSQRPMTSASMMPASMMSTSNQSIQNIPMSAAAQRNAMTAQQQALAQRTIAQQQAQNSLQSRLASVAVPAAAVGTYAAYNSNSNSNSNVSHGSVGMLSNVPASNGMPSMGMTSMGMPSMAMASNPSQIAAQAAANQRALASQQQLMAQTQGNLAAKLSAKSQIHASSAQVLSNASLTSLNPSMAASQLVSNQQQAQAATQQRMSQQQAQLAANLTARSQSNSAVAKKLTDAAASQQAQAQRMTNGLGPASSESPGMNMNGLQSSKSIYSAI